MFKSSDILVCMSDYVHQNYYCKQFETNCENLKQTFSRNFRMAVSSLLDIAELPLSNLNRDNIIEFITGKTNSCELEDGFSIESSSISNLIGDYETKFSILKNNVVLIEFLIIKNHVINLMYNHVGILLKTFETNKDSSYVKQFAASFSGEPFDFILDEFNQNVSFEMSKKLDSNINPMYLLKISTIKQMAYFSQYAKNQHKLDITLFKMLPNNY